MSRWVHPGTRAVFFDAVGTLLFPEPSAPQIYADLARRNGLGLTDEVIWARFVAAYRVEEAADRAAGWVTSEEREYERWHRIVTATLHGVPDPDACFLELFDHFSKPAAWRLHPEAGPVLAELRNRGLVLGLGTNYDARVWPVVEGFPALAPIRDRMIVSAAVGFRKPAPGFFKELLKSAGCAPAAVLFVGDDIENDYKGATAAGLNTVLLYPTNRSYVPNRITTLSELIESPG